MSEADKLEAVAPEDAGLLENDDTDQNAALDDERPTSRSDAKDPWHGLNDFDED